MKDFYTRLLALLDRQERRSLVLLLGVILLTSLIETMGIVSILPFLAVIANPEVVETNAWLAAAYAASGLEDRRSFLVLLGTLVFAVMVTGLVFKLLRSYLMVRFVQMRNYSLGIRMLRGYLAQPYAWYLDKHSSDLSKSVLSEVASVVSGSIMPAMQLIASAVLAVCIVTVVIVVDPVIAAVSAAVLGGSYALLYVVTRGYLERLGAERVALNRERFRAVQEAASGIKEAKVLEMEPILLRRFHRAAGRIAHLQTLSSLISQSPRFVLEAVLFGGMILLVLHLLTTRPGGLAEIIPLLGLYAFAALRLFPALQAIFAALTRIRFGKAALESLGRDLAETGGMPERGPPPPPLHFTGRLTLEGVRLSYPGAERPALDGLDLDIAARTTVGLVGGSGAGKTSTVDVILGLLEPEAGALRVDGCEIRGEALRGWRRALGYVPQHIYLTADTIAANIAFGVPAGAIDRAAVERAARIAELHDFILSELPEGYDTRVGERGVRLSGGQRQRVGIARALYHDPDVLILDEATSALDTVTERAVMQSIHGLARVKTVIMVAHRLSTVRDCDEIFVLDQGRVVARGSYDTLIAGSTVFRKLANEPA